MIESKPVPEDPLAPTGDLPAGAASVAERFDIKRSIGRKLSVAARQVVRRFDRTVEAQGVSRAKFTVIALVALRPGASQRFIADRLGISEVTAGRLVERLCADGYLERRANPNDRRTHFIYPTIVARPMLDMLDTIAVSQEKETFAGFSEEELATLNDFLDRIVANVAAASVSES